MNTGAGSPEPLEPSGPTRLSGGPGSGKTAALVDLVARALGAGLDPSRVLVVVPSWTAALEFNRWLDPGSRAVVRPPWIMTHERLARWVLERSGEGPAVVLGRVGESIAMRAAIERCAPLLGELARLADAPGCVDGLLDLCGSFSQALVGPALLASRVSAHGGVLAEVTVLAATYQALLEEMGATDTKQLAGVALDRLQASPQEWRGFADLLVVDQAEDLSPAQWYLLRELALLLSPPGRFVVAGDATVAGAQRYGPTSRCFEEFLPRELHPAEWSLPVSGPATQLAEIWGMAGSPRPAGAGLPRGGPPGIRMWRAEDETQEAFAVAREIRRLCLEEGVPYDQVAVVAAGGSGQLPAILQALQSVGVPARLEMGPWSGSPVASQLQEWLEALCNPGDDRTLLRALQGGRGGITEPQALRLRRRAARDQVSLARALRAPDREPAPGPLAHRRRLWAELGGGDPGLADRRLSGGEFLRLLGALEVGLSLSALALEEVNSASALARLNLAVEDAGAARDLLGLGPAPLREWAHILRVAVRRSGWEVERAPHPERPEVAVLTLGQAKGRRWPQVFLAGVADGFLPGSQSGRDLLTAEERQRLLDLVPELEEVLGPGDRIAQERRRFLTGMTRADRQVTISWAARYGEEVMAGSRFTAALASLGLEPVPVPTLRDVTRADCAAELAAAISVAPPAEVPPAVPRAARDLAALLKPWDPTSWNPRPATVHLSATSLRSWLACPRLFHYHRLRLPSEDTPELVLGTAAHRLLESLYRDPAVEPGVGDEFQQRGLAVIRDQLMPWVRERLCDPLAASAVERSLREIMFRWEEHIVEAGPGAVGSPVAMEVPFELERPGYVLEGRVDALWRRPTGELEVVDFKTGHVPTSRGQLSDSLAGDPEKPPVDWQLAIYELAADSGALDAASGGARPSFVRNWYLALDPSSRVKVGLPVRGYALGEDSDRPAWHDALLTPDRLRRFEGLLDREAARLRQGAFAAAPRHGTGTCLDDRGCPFSVCCDGAGSVGAGLGPSS